MDSLIRDIRLSREMEFHADAVASVSGGNNLITALHRVEMADYGYNYTLEKCNEHRQISANIYSNQASVFRSSYGL
jgi:Zn-dependent protease with chaperone function